MTLDAILNRIPRLQGKGFIVLVVVTFPAAVFVKIRILGSIVFRMFFMAERGDPLFMGLVRLVFHFDDVLNSGSGVQRRGQKDNAGNNGEQQ
jgi:hypothetical protein